MPCHVMSLFNYRGFFLEGEEKEEEEGRKLQFLTHEVLA